MKRVFFLSMLVAVYFLVPSEITNAATNLSDVETTKDLHQSLKELNLIELDENGLIKLSTELTSLEVRQELSEEYIDIIDLLNKQIKNGIISMDKDLDIIPTTTEEIADRVYKSDKENNETKFSTMDTVLSVPMLVEYNRSQLEETFDSYFTVSPTNAFNMTVGWWVAKVKPGGVWDYKVVDGYSPWYREFTMELYNGVRQTHNSKWLGNYNYGYTGEFLFPLPILLAGGDAVSIALNFEPDTPEVKQTIEWGFSDAYFFY